MGMKIWDQPRLVIKMLKMPEMPVKGFSGILWMLNAIGDLVSVQECLVLPER